MYKTVLVVLLAITVAYCAYSMNSYSAPFDKDFELLNAEDKRKFIWDYARNTPGMDTPASWPSKTALIGLLKPEWLGGQSFTPVGHNTSDQNAPGWKKLIHTVGMHVQIRIDFEKTPFSGQFGDSSAIGILRASSASKPTASSNAPGISVKLFRDRVPSANFVAMWNLFGQGAEMNFFKHPFSNHVSNLPNFEFGAQWVSLKALSTRFSYMDDVTNMVGLSDIAKVNGKGDSNSTEVKAPFALVFQPDAAVQALCENSSFDNMKGGTYDCLDKIAAGTTLYHIWYVDGPVEKANASSSDLKKLGTMVTESGFFPSKFIDEQVQFRHVFWADEVKALNKPEWGGSNLSEAFRQEDGAEKWEGKFPPL